MEGIENTETQDRVEDHGPKRANSDSFKSHKRHHNKSPDDTRAHDFSSSDGVHHRRRKPSKDCQDLTEKESGEGRRRHSRNRSSTPRESPQTEKEIPGLHFASAISPEMSPHHSPRFHPSPPLPKKLTDSPRSSRSGSSSRHASPHPLGSRSSSEDFSSFVPAEPEDGKTKLLDPFTGSDGSPRHFETSLETLQEGNEDEDTLNMKRQRRISWGAGTGKTLVLNPRRDRSPINSPNAQVILLNAKAYFLGKEGVGKSSLVQHLATGSFGVLDRYDKKEYSIRIQISQKNAPTKSMVVVDTQFSSPLYIAKPDPKCLVFVFSLVDLASFDFVEPLINDYVEQYSDAETASPPCFLVGTKVDHIAPDNPRQIPLERCTKMAEKMNAIYLEISSRVGTNIDTFKVVLLNAAEKVSQKTPPVPMTPPTEVPKISTSPAAEKSVERKRTKSTGSPNARNLNILPSSPITISVSTNCKNASLNASPMIQKPPVGFTSASSSPPIARGPPHAGSNSTSPISISPAPTRNIQTITPPGSPAITLELIHTQEPGPTTDTSTSTTL